MHIIAPVTIVDSIIDSNSVAESEHSTWAGGTTYALDDRVIYEHRIYESQQASNTGNQPDTDDGTWWLDVGPTNAWAMFDDKVHTATSDTVDIVVEITPGAIVNAVALLGLAGDSATVEVDDPTEGIVYSRTESLVSFEGIHDWYTYFFAEFGTTQDLVFMDLPSYRDATITITIATSTGNAQAAVLVIGTQLRIGDTTYGSDVGILDFSRKDVDDFGNVDIEQRNFSKTGDFDFELYTNEIATVQKRLAFYRATPAVWVGVIGREETYIYGFYRDFSLVIAGPILSIGNIEIEGLI